MSKTSLLNAVHLCLFVTYYLTIISTKSVNEIFRKIRNKGKLRMLDSIKKVCLVVFTLAAENFCLHTSDDHQFGSRMVIEKTIKKATGDDHSVDRETHRKQST